MRVLLVYDCLYPFTVGGAERWMRNLGERLAAAGHDVTYATLRQWDRGEAPDVAGVRVVAVGPRMALYGRGGARRFLPPIVFGAGVAWPRVRPGRRYDVVHTASFPYFSLLAAGALRRFGGYRLVVDWHELWTREYWREYVGAVAGRVGWTVQRLCARLPQTAFCFARVTAGRLAEGGGRGPVTVLEGQWDGRLRAEGPAPAEPVVVFAGRQIAEKRAEALVPALAWARERVPELRAVLYGDGPRREAVQRAVDEAGLGGVVEVPGFVDAATLDAAFASALCMALPSRREGYGKVVIEAASRGVPSVVVDEPDNAAVELVEDGVNGVVAASAEPEVLGAALVRVHEAGPALRDSTARWFTANAERLSLGRSLETVLAAYRTPAATARD